MAPSDLCLMVFKPPPLEYRLDLKYSKYWTSLLRLDYKKTGASILFALSCSLAFFFWWKLATMLSAALRRSPCSKELREAMLTANKELKPPVQQPFRNWIMSTIVQEGLEAHSPSVGLSDETTAPSHTLHILSCERLFSRSTRLSSTKIYDNKCLLF